MPVEPGVYNMPMGEYLALEAVNASIIRGIVQECPRAAWFRSVFNPNRRQEESSTDQLIGSAAHALLLENSEGGIVVVDADSWRTNAAKEAKEQALAEGKIPLLPGKMHTAKAMANVARGFIESLKDKEPGVWAAFQPDGGVSEETIVWEENGILCKIRIDRANTEHTIEINYKTTGTSANPETWARTQMFANKYYTGSAFYRRGMVATFGEKRTEHAFLVQENVSPYLCSLVGISPEVMDLGERQVERTLAQLAECAKSCYWPGYEARAEYPELPPWESAGWEVEG